MAKYVFLEGLPGVGKTTILNSLKKLKIPNVFLVEEILHDQILNGIANSENDYIVNDELKLKKYNQGTIVLDRGPVSSLSYAYVKEMIDKKYSATNNEVAFDKNLYIWENSCKVIYLTNNGKNYCITVDNKKSPYGSVKNQQKLEETTLSVIEKYCKNYKIINYDKKDMGEVINEIIN